MSRFYGSINSIGVRIGLVASALLLTMSPSFAGWEKCGAGVELKHISVRNKNDIWGVSYKNKVFRFNGKKWRKTSLSAKQVSVAKDGSIVILSAQNLISIKDANGAITPVTGSLAQVSRAHGRNGGMWGVNSKNQVYAYNPPQWASLSGVLKHVSVGSDTTVWGVNPGGDAYLWGTKSGQWAQKSKGLNLAEISCANASNVWAVGASGSVYRYNGNRFVPVKGKLAHIAVGYDNSVFGVTGRGQLLRFVKASRVKRRNSLAPSGPKYRSQIGQTQRVAVGGAEFPRVKSSTRSQSPIRQSHLKKTQSPLPSKDLKSADSLQAKTSHGTRSFAGVRTRNSHHSNP